MTAECPTCGQIDIGQTGKYPCPECGLPRVWDDRPLTPENIAWGEQKAKEVAAGRAMVFDWSDITEEPPA